MPKSRPMASLFLTVLLVFTPLLRGYAAMPPHSDHASQAASQHSNHHGSVAQHTPGKSVCAQHNFCNGLCCASCAQSFSIIVFLPAAEDARLPVLTPIEPHLVSTPFATLRERPPRTLSL